MEKKVLVTGAPGWLGTRLVEDLVNKNRKVRCLVIRGIDVSDLTKLKGVELFYGDITKPKTLEGITKDIETVFHCIGIIHPKTAKGFFEINYNGTRNIINQCIKNNVKRFIYISSNAAQGFNSSRNKLMDENGPMKPESNYGLSKYKAERLIDYFHKSYGLETVILRPCLFYGIRQPGRFTKFMNMVRSGRPLVFGNGKNLRSMTHIDNLVQACLLAEKSKKANGKVYWIADKKPYTTIEIIQTIADEFNVKLKPIYLPEFLSRICEQIDIFLGNMGFYSLNFHVVGESYRNIGCSIKKAEEELDYKPKFYLKKGIKEAVDWARENKVL